MGPHPTATDLEHWHIWSTPTYGTSGESWSAMPDGAKGAVVFATSRAELERLIRKCMRHLDVHVAEARRKLDALPADYTGEREDRGPARVPAFLFSAGGVGGGLCRRSSAWAPRAAPGPRRAAGAATRRRVRPRPGAWPSARFPPAAR